jgi:hypothetical protein
MSSTPSFDLRNIVVESMLELQQAFINVTSAGCCLGGWGNWPHYITSPRTKTSGNEISLITLGEGKPAIVARGKIIKKSLLL